MLNVAGVGRVGFQRGRACLHMDACISLAAGFGKCSIFFAVQEKSYPLQHEIIGFVFDFNFCFE